GPGRPGSVANVPAQAESSVSGEEKPSEGSQKH
ncbi:preprotein translocase subunit SecG, partial [Stenotrophomonas maltophilia]